MSFSTSTNQKAVSLYQPMRRHFQLLHNDSSIPQAYCLFVFHKLVSQNLL